MIGLGIWLVYSLHAGLRSAYRNGEFSLVEAVVTNFHLMPYEGHQDGCFSVQSDTFCYSDFVVTAGFNNSASHGGTIREGLPSAFHTSATLLLVWRSGPMPSPARQNGPQQPRARAMTGSTTRARSCHHADELRICDCCGFHDCAVEPAAGAIHALWAQPSYQALTINVFRLFFLANLIGAVWYLVDEVK